MSTRTLRIPLFGTLLLALSIIAFGGAIHNAIFQAWDDQLYLSEKLLASPLSTETLAWIATSTDTGNWHPLTLLSHAVDIALFGMNPAPHRIESLILHMLNALLVFWLTWRLGQLWHTKSHGPKLSDTMLFSAAAATSLFFAIHPLRVESVVWLSERKDLLYALFYLLSIHAYLSYVVAIDVSSRRRNYAWSLCLFLLSCLSKPMAVTLPALLLVLDRYPLNRPTLGITWQHLLQEKLPFFTITLLFSVANIVFQSGEGAVLGMDDLDFTQRLFNASHNLILYITQTLVPLHPLPYYPFHEYLLHPSFYAVSSVFVVLAITAIVTWACRWRGRCAITAALFSYFIMISPVIGLLQTGAQASADRYTYLTTLPLYLCLALYSTTMLQKHNRSIRHLSLALFSLYIAWLTYQSAEYSKHWRDDITLWSYALSIQPTNIAVALKLANSRNLVHDYKGADRLYSYADKLMGGSPYIRLEQCRSQLKHGNYQGSIETCTQLTRLYPAYKDSEKLLGIAYSNVGEYQAAASHLELALQKTANKTDIQLPLADAFIHQGRTAEAQTLLMAIIAREPMNREASELLQQLDAARSAPIDK